MNSHSQAKELSGLWEIVKNNTPVNPYHPANKCVQGQSDAFPEIWSLNQTLNEKIFDPNLLGLVILPWPGMAG